MTRRIDGLLSEWAEDIVLNAHKSGFSGINVVEKILRDPGISTGGSRHKAHWWPRNKRIAMMSRAMHNIGHVSQIVLIIHYGRILKEDGTVFTKHDLAKTSSIGLRRFNEIRRKAVTKLQVITNT